MASLLMDIYITQWSPEISLLIWMINFSKFFSSDLATYHTL